MGLGVEFARRQPPELAEGRVGQLQAAVGAEHRDAFLQRVKGFALHPRLRVELRLEMAMRGDVVEEVGDAALRVRD